MLQKNNDMNNSDNNLLYVLTPFSMYLVRIDKEQVSDVYLNSAAKAIEDNFKVDPHKQLQIPT